MLLITFVASCLVWLVLGFSFGYLLCRNKYGSNETTSDAPVEDTKPSSEPPQHAGGPTYQPPGKRRKERRAAVMNNKKMPSEAALEAMRLKMVLIVRKDKNLTVAETASEASDAAISVIGKTLFGGASLPIWVDWYNWWSAIGVAKITLRCPDEQAFSDIIALAQAKHLPFSAVPSQAVVAIGPAPADELDPITGSLKLLS